MKCLITISAMGKKNPYFRVTLRDAKGEPLLSREFTQKHIAIGMAVLVGSELGIEPDLAIRLGDDDENEDTYKC